MTKGEVVLKCRVDGNVMEEVFLTIHVQLVLCMPHAVIPHFCPSFFTILLTAPRISKDFARSLVVAGSAPLSVPGAHVRELSTSVAALVFEQRLNVLAG